MATSTEQHTMTAPTAHQAARRRVFVLVTIAVAAALTLGVVGLAVLHQRQVGVIGYCATEFEENKTELEGYRWSWIPPGWVCEFRNYRAPSQEQEYERRLPPFAT